jgi:hypothetical protein
VRNVAIGQYDATYLGYPHHEGWKFSQMTGELYVDDGLDQAVNIDRASFRESDEGFIALQKFLFSRLQTGADEGAGIFTDIKRETKKIREEERTLLERKRQRHFKRLIEERGETRAQQTTQAERTSGVAVVESAVEVREELITLVPKRQRDLFRAVCGIIENEIHSSVAASKRRALYERLAALFRDF